MTIISYEKYITRLLKKQRRVKEAGGNTDKIKRAIDRSRMRILYRNEDILKTALGKFQQDDMYSRTYGKQKSELNRPKYNFSTTPYEEVRDIAATIIEQERIDYQEANAKHKREDRIPKKDWKFSVKLPRKPYPKNRAKARTPSEMLFDKSIVPRKTKQPGYTVGHIHGIRKTSEGDVWGLVKRTPQALAETAKEGGVGILGAGSTQQEYFMNYPGGQTQWLRRNLINFFRADATQIRNPLSYRGMELATGKSVLPWEGVYREWAKEKDWKERSPEGHTYLGRLNKFPRMKGKVTALETRIQKKIRETREKYTFYMGEVGVFPGRFFLPVITGIFNLNETVIRVWIRTTPGVKKSEKNYIAKEDLELLLEPRAFKFFFNSYIRDEINSDHLLLTLITGGASPIPKESGELRKAVARQLKISPTMEDDYMDEIKIDLDSEPSVSQYAYITNSMPTHWLAHPGIHKRKYHNGHLLEDPMAVFKIAITKVEDFIEAILSYADLMPIVEQIYELGEGDEYLKIRKQLRKSIIIELPEANLTPLGSNE